jgi:hypothetical protein
MNRGFWVQIALLACGLAFPVRAEQAAGPFAARVEGYLGFATLDYPSAYSDPRGFTGGGGASAALSSGLFAAQLDVFGDGAEYDKGFEALRSTGVGAHIGLRDSSRAAMAISLGWNHGESTPFDPSDGRLGASRETYRVGGEYEAYLGIVTLGANAGYLELENSKRDAYYARGFVRVYPTDNIRAELLGGVIENPSDGDDPTDIARLELQYRFPELPVSVFGRWEATFDAADSHQAVLGVRLYFDGDRTLIASDREAFFDGCTLVHSGARTC